ncbi:MAG: thiamine diphosphokinase [Chloroflexi bacterium]|nr:thiamine diphosphokinase [Chloroflexota bacterium]
MPVPPIQRALVFSNGDLHDGPAVQSALAHAAESLTIAADGGARLALACGIVPQYVVGDMDSLSPAELDDLRERGAAIERFPAEKNETDLELALLAAIRQGADWVRIIGAAGGRLDQMIANLLLLAMSELAGRDVRAVDDHQTIWLIDPGDHGLDGAPGDTISLLPLGGDAFDVRTTGMLYPLCGETLFFGPARGVSNVIKTLPARVSFSAGRLLVVHTPGRA